MEVRHTQPPPISSRALRGVASSMLHIGKKNLEPNLNKLGQTNKMNDELSMALDIIEGECKQ